MIDFITACCMLLMIDYIVISTIDHWKKRERSDA